MGDFSDRDSSLHEDYSGHLGLMEFTVEGEASCLTGCDCYVRVLDRRRLCCYNSIVCVGRAYGKRVVLVRGVVEVNCYGIAFVNDDEVRRVDIVRAEI